VTARTARLRDKRTGKVYWVQHRTGFSGREFNFGGGWRPTPRAAQEAAEKSGTLSEAPGQATS
jgi:hypothetical protein